MAERTYRIHIAAEFSGVRVELIRAWERRYGVLSPQRTPSGYRVYTDRDVALLRRLKQLTEEGVSISEAAKMLPQLLAEIDAAQPSQSPPPEPSDGSVASWREEVLAAVKALDQRRVSETLDEVLAALSPLKAYEDVLVPLQQEVGELWHQGVFTVGQEHLVTQEIRARLISLLHAAPNKGPRHALLACFPEEQHELGLLGMALRLRHSGMTVTLLGQRTPTDEVVRMARALEVDLVGLSSVVDVGAREFEEILTRVTRGLATGTAIWVGGRAALQYRALCERLGVRVFEHAADWPRLLED
ncbi:MerR family transcriptional regulator [Cystobacter fuscus]|uniref:MerR family transcriptional regulator n=1 Tax=Cystobacter fuscus TaxID=43 RepID=UPI002B2D448B|nr:MerR family transcriptional regulator [Cystobacter fuscus]